MLLNTDPREGELPSVSEIREVRAVTPYERFAYAEDL